MTKDNNTSFYIDKRKNSLSLNGEWEYTYLDSVDSTENIRFGYKTHLPSSSYKSVFESGLLPDYTKAANSKLYRDLKQKVFCYRRYFDVPKTESGKQVYLCFDGAAYFTEVFINGQSCGEHIGISAGPYLNVTRLLKDKNNEIVITAKAPSYGNDCFDPWNSDMQSDIIIPWGFSGDAKCNNGDFTINGVWNDIRLEFVPKVHISRPFLSTVSANERSAKLHLSLELTNEIFDELDINRGFYSYPCDFTFAYDEGLTGKTLDRAVDITVNISDENGTAYERNESVKLLDYQNCVIKGRYFDSQFVERDLEIKNPSLWYPSNMGEPHLYTVKITASENGKQLDEHEFAFGIRTITTEFSKGGRYTFDREKFQFVINGKKVFIRGVNMMPEDVMLDLTEEIYRRNLTLVKEAGIGLIRLWGGAGIYETDTFYRLCDELGIMVWQDSLIANMATPKWDVRILDSLVSANVYRIRNHASLAVYCGGNEFEPYNVHNASSLGRIRRTTTILDPTRVFYDTTPVGGSAHIYKDMEPSRYRKMYKHIPFVAETGIHSFPTYKSLVPLISQKELCDRCDGLSEQYIKTHPEISNHIIENNPERIPRMVSRSTQLIDVKNADIKAICESTQIAAYEYYQIMCAAMTENYPVTAGLMPWVFTRPWTTVGIQLADSAGFACMQYYAVKKGYENVSAMLCLEEMTYAAGEGFEVRTCVINHRREKLCGLSLTVAIYSPSLDEVYRYTKSVSVSGYKKYAGFPCFSIPREFTDNFFFVSVRLEGDGIQVHKVYKPKVLSEMSDKAFREKYRSGMENNFIYERRTVQSEQIKDFRAELSLSAKRSPEDPQQIQLTLTNSGKYPAYPVILDTDSQKPFRPSDNCMFLEPKEKRVISVNLAGCDAKEITAHGWNFETAKTVI